MIMIAPIAKGVIALDLIAMDLIDLEPIDLSRTTWVAPMTRSAS